MQFRSSIEIRKAEFSCGGGQRMYGRVLRTQQRCRMASAGIEGVAMDVRSSKLRLEMDVC
jgi:hypothetical protein